MVQSKSNNMGRRKCLPIHDPKVHHPSVQRSIRCHVMIIKVTAKREHQRWGTSRHLRVSQSTVANFKVAMMTFTWKCATSIHFMTACHHSMKPRIQLHIRLSLTKLATDRFSSRTSIKTCRLDVCTLRQADES